MKKNFLLGLSNSGTTIKAGLYDLRGREAVLIGAPIPILKRDGNIVEVNTEQLWKTSCRVIRSAITAAGLVRANVVGISISGSANGLCVLNRDGSTSGILSAAGASEILAQWKTDGTDAEVARITLQRTRSEQSPALLRWLKDNDPAGFSRIGTILSFQDYLRYRLTGIVRAEVTCWSAGNMMNLRERSYDSRLLELFGIEETADALPPLCTALAPCGGVTRRAAAACGLPAGIPVAGGVLDRAAAVLACGVADDRYISLSASGCAVLSRRPVVHEPIPANSLFADPRFYMLSEWAPSFAGIQDLPRSSDRRSLAFTKAMRRWHEAYSEQDGKSVFLSAFFAQLTGQLGLRECRNFLKQSDAQDSRWSASGGPECAPATTALQSIRLVGTDSRTPDEIQLMADILQLPVERAAVRDSETLGSAMAAAVATGHYKTIQDAAAGMTEIAETVEPQSMTSVQSMGNRLEVSTREPFWITWFDLEGCLW